MSLDQRALDPSVLASMLDAAQEATARIATEEDVSVEWERLWRIEPIPFDEDLISLAEEACNEVAGRSHRLPSGPLHDAAEMARLMPTVMLFVKSLRGPQPHQRRGHAGRGPRALRTGAAQAREKDDGLGSELRRCRGCRRSWSRTAWS